ncbi:hypothetical protein [Mesorhizobium sp. M0520]|uniref:hypothetical protein n=1 Tax=Mesorhizobium sp. M0520 TaxID=2956957 RepID=UPI0033390B96
MADVTGPISTLPGSGHDFPDGTPCDEHPDRQAVARIQGETDSFGSEMNDMCQECLDAYREEMKNADWSGVCDWCKDHKPRLRPRRDYEEGMAGRVYDVCDDCIKRENDELEKEIGTYWDDDGEGYDD